MYTDSITTNNSQNGTKRRVYSKMRSLKDEYGKDSHTIAVRIPVQLEEQARVVAAQNRASLQGIIRDYIQKVVETGEINPGETKVVVKETPPIVQIKEVPAKARKMDDTLRTAYGLVVQDIISNLV